MLIRLLTDVLETSTFYLASHTKYTLPNNWRRVLDDHRQRM